LRLVNNSSYLSKDPEHVKDEPTRLPLRQGALRLISFECLFHKSVVKNAWKLYILKIMKQLHFLKFSFLATALATSSCHCLSASPLLTIDSAIERAYHCSPTLSAANAEVSIRSAEAYQAGLLPNPVATVELSGPGSWRSHRDCNDAELLFAITQFFEMGGKRSKREYIAALGISEALWELENAKLDISSNVSKALIDVAAAQEHVRIAERQKHIAEQLYQSVTTKVDAGKVASLQARKAEISVTTSTLAHEKAVRQFGLAKRNLAAFWNNLNPDFENVCFPLFEIIPLPSYASLEALLYRNPNMMKWEIEICTARGIIEQEVALSVPDLTVTAGVTCERHEKSSLTLGVSIPLPIFDRNQGNICRAQHELTQLQELKRENILALNMSLAYTYDNLLTAYKDCLAYRDNILAAAMEAFDSAREGYQEGKYDYLELLDAQRTLFEIEEQYIDTLVEFHDKLIDVYRLVGNAPG